MEETTTRNTATTTTATNITTTASVSTTASAVVSPLRTTMSTQPQQRPSSSPSLALTVAALRRSSSHVTPTRTLHLSEQEHRIAAVGSPTPPSQRPGSSAASVWTMESLQQRPRSNQRTRTPRRNPSPELLNPDEFRRQRQPSPVAAAPSRVTIRVGAGNAVGANLRNRGRGDSPHRNSSKQGQPSHRKSRRWNNDHLDHLAAEIAPTSRRAAEVLLKGKKYAHLYKAVYDPTDHESKAMTRFLQDRDLQSLKSRFFEGELPSLPTEELSSQVQRHHHHQAVTSSSSGEAMLRRIDARLRRVVVRACANSYPACRVVKTFEACLLQSFFGVAADHHPHHQQPPLAEDWWQDLLLASPTTITNTKTTTIDKDDKNQEQQQEQTMRFLFHPTDSTGGFHRLLLHAVCQFHGLSAVSRMITMDHSSNSSTAADADGTSLSSVAAATAPHNNNIVHTQSRALLVTEGGGLAFSNNNKINNKNSSRVRLLQALGADSENTKDDDYWDDERKIIIDAEALSVVGLDDSWTVV